MYRIEVAPGEETVFRTIEELAIGIRNGVITPRARVFHAASQKWLPIEFHPHYRKALTGPVASPMQPSPPPTTPNFSTPTGVPAHPPAPAAGGPLSPPAPPSPSPAPSSHPAPRPTPPKSHTAPWVMRPHDIPTPKPSSVFSTESAMLRDLPVVSIPEPEPRRPAGTWPPVLVEPIVHPPVATRHEAYAHAHEPHLAEEAPHPVARRTHVRRRSQPLVLLGVVVILAAGAHFVRNAKPSVAPADLSVTPPPPPDQSDDYSDTPPPVDEEPMEQPPTVEVAAQPAAQVTIVPARVPMTPGPAFAGSVPARPRPDSVVAPRKPPVGPSKPTATPAAIEPAPAGVDLGLPDVPKSDSLAPVVKSGDSLAIRRILRALNGVKPAEPSVAP